MITLVNFMGSQGFVLKHNVLYQDIQRTMKIKQNGKNSFMGQSHHINICYFFVQDNIAKKEIDLEYCPTDEILADFFTKPLEGKLFRKIFEVIMGYQPITWLKQNVTKSTMSLP